MKSKWSYKILIALFLCVLLLPGVLFLVSALSGQPCDVKLKGYFNSDEVPSFNLENISDGSFQGGASEWFNHHFPPRGLLIKTYNTMRYEMFRQGNNIVGKDSYIFEYSYVSSELMLEDKNDLSLPESQEDMREYVYKLTCIEEALHEQGKGLVYYISASKANTCHDKLPDNYVNMSPEDGIRPVDYLRQLFDEAGFDYLYTPDLMEGLPSPAFYASGIHWSRPFEQIVSLAVLDKISLETGKTYPSWELTELESSTEPYTRDTDVFDSMNVWNPPFDEAFYQYKTELVTPDVYDDLHILMQGGSFSHGFWSDVWEHYPEACINYVNYCEYFYDSHEFYSLSYSDGLPREKLLGFIEESKNENLSTLETFRRFCLLFNKWDNVPLETLLSESDCVVIEINESVITNYSYGFVDELYALLCQGGKA